MNTFSMIKTISRGTALLLCLTALGLPAQTSRNKERRQVTPITCMVSTCIRR